MKIISYLFIFSILSLPLVHAQSFDEALESPAHSEEEYMDSEELSAIIDGEQLPEQERQEDVIHPEGEHDWSLGSEDLPAEDFE